MEAAEVAAAMTCNLHPRHRHCQHGRHRSSQNCKNIIKSIVIMMTEFCQRSHRHLRSCGRHPTERKRRKSLARKIRQIRMVNVVGCRKIMSRVDFSITATLPHSDACNLLVCVSADLTSPCCSNSSTELFDPIVGAPLNEECLRRSAIDVRVA